MTAPASLVPLSVIVPVLNEAAGIEATLRALQPMRARGAEIVVVDGGSTDATRLAAAPLADRVLQSPRGRAAQMNAGANAARGDVLVFVHADTLLPAAADEHIAAAIASGREWGRFDVAIDSAHPLLLLVALMMNARSRWTGVATGDQAIFVRRAAFEAAGGYPDIPLMEDVALSKGLRRRGAPACLRERVITSGRRWERHGMLRTIVLMWRLRLAYAMGADPRRLARRYDVEHTSS
jgi:rSAM/selenodomain-associated transferase 2